MNTIAELKAHYNRGRESYENLRRFPKRINKEKYSLQLDRVTIDKNDKFSHYLHKLYQSGTFTDETVIEWKNKTTADQTYANAIIFSEKKKHGMDKVCWITGNKNSGKNGFSSANAGIEWGN